MKHWYVGGHSLGGIAAQAVISKNLSAFDGLIVIGVYTAEQYDLSDWDRNVISIHAENDQLSTVQEINDNKNWLPAGKEVGQVTEINGLSSTIPLVRLTKTTV